MNADFLDANIFVYLFDETDERRCEIARRLVHEGKKGGGRARPVYQVCRAGRTHAS
jgi:predicted nucleic acid-binding protein